MGNTGLRFIPRRVNLNALANLGISIPDAESVVYSLAAQDYESGPDIDDDGTAGEMWVFGTQVGETDIYVKLKLEAGRAACISFHEAQYPLRSPLR